MISINHFINLHHQTYIQCLPCVKYCVICMCKALKVVKIAEFGSYTLQPNMACELFLYSTKLRVGFTFLKKLKKKKEHKIKVQDRDPIWSPKPEIFTLPTILLLRKLNFNHTNVKDKHKIKIVPFNNDNCIDIFVDQTLTKHFSPLFRLVLTTKPQERPCYYHHFIDNSVIRNHFSDLSIVI